MVIWVSVVIKEETVIWSILGCQLFCQLSISFFFFIKSRHLEICCGPKISKESFSFFYLETCLRTAACIHSVLTVLSRQENGASETRRRINVSVLFAALLDNWHQYALVWWYTLHTGQKKCIIWRIHSPDEFSLFDRSNNSFFVFRTQCNLCKS